MKSLVKSSLILPICLFGVTDFELINHNDKSVTGDGVFVGVIDSLINQDHPSLSGQIQEQVRSNYTDFIDVHGSHVAGIILAKPGDGVSGVAIDAKAYGVQIFGYDTNGSSMFIDTNVYDYFKDKNIAAINNSWNATHYPLSGLDSPASSLDIFVQYANNPDIFRLLIEDIKIANDLINLSKDKQILSVFSSGNEGIITPGIMALAPYYDEDIRSMIVVTALDSSQISKDSNGKFVMTANSYGGYASGPTTYANGLKGLYNFGLAAPGTNVKNVNGIYGFTNISTGKLDSDLYRALSGTSMAAPMVTGAAALVAQKFPFMSGKQIADTLLSTANKDYIAPKVIVKETVTGDTICDNGSLCPSKSKYTVFYIDNKIPKKADGSIDEIAVRIDLMRSGYLESGWKNYRLSDIKDIDDKVYPWVQEVTKEDLFGQGILDIDKALKGLGILDANRLSDADVKSEFGQTAVYYSLDTKGSDAEFSNDISQRKWEASTHNPEAHNLPKNLDNLNVGLIKSGSGVLTLSGANSYEGATVINGGGIRLLNKDSKTAQIAGNVYVNNGSTLSGNGTIKQNLTNDNSIIRPGNEDLSNLVVDGTYTQNGQNSKLILDFGNDDNSQLIAKDYNISGGNLEYNPLKQYYTVNKEIKIELGGLATYIDNFTQVEVTNSNSIDFEIKLDSDKTTVTPAIKFNAYNSDSATLSQTMRKIRNDANLSKKYHQIFSTLDSSDSNTYQETMSRIEGNSVFDLTSINTQNHTSFYQNNMLFSINPASSTLFSYNSNPYDSGIFVASVASDYAIDLGFDSLKPKNYWYINPTYKRYNGNGFDGYQSGVSLNLAHKLDDGTISYGIGASKSSLDFDIGAKSKSDTLSLALNYTYDFGSFKLLSGGSALVAFNENERELSGTIKGEYKSYSSNLELGVAKDYSVANFTISPLAYLSYGYIYQDSFKESGEIFAKSYDNISQSIITAAAGINGSYQISDNLRYIGYALYERMLQGYNMDAKAEFNDFIGEKFTQRYHLDKNRLNIGLGAEYVANSGYFFKFAAGGEFASTSNNLNLSATIGKRF